MQKQTYQWQLVEGMSSAIERYCSHCGKKVIFRDSQKRRHNANGKTVYEYAIYKCDKDHTWNRMIQSGKAAYITKKPSDNTSENTGNASLPVGNDDEGINLSQQKNRGICIIEIKLQVVTGRWRLDKLLGDRIIDASRKKICEMIENGTILVDDMLVKQNTILKQMQVITIFLENVSSQNIVNESLDANCQNGCGEKVV